MTYGGPLDSYPLWLLFCGTVAIVCIAVEVGYQLGRYRRKHAPELDTPVNAMVAAMLGLLAFMLAFTFGMAVSRYDERRHTVLDDANAIGTTYLRAGLLKDPERTEIRRLLREYVDIRLSNVKQEQIGEALAKSTDLQNQLWARAATIAGQDTHSIVTGLFIQSLNEMIDLHAKRVKVGLRSRIPTIVWLSLFFVALLTMTTMGFHEGVSGSRRSLASFAVVVAFSVILFLIFDLDRPTEGLVRVSQQSLQDLQESMKNQTP